MKSSNEDGKGHEFDYYDEYPEDDPFLPKPSCARCGGSGMVLTRDGKYLTCYSCNGTGVEDGH